MVDRNWVRMIAAVMVGGMLLAYNRTTTGAENGMVPGGYQRHRMPSFPNQHAPWHPPDYSPEANHLAGPLDRFGRPQSPEGSWFQRPYPYHLDYYRWRYQGSYAPYFGNLYGPPTYIVPPAVVAPPTYGYGIEDGGVWHW